jgi:hypothetical protein
MRGRAHPATLKIDPPSPPWRATAAFQPRAGRGPGGQGQARLSAADARHAGALQTTRRSSAGEGDPRGLTRAVTNDHS